MPTSRKPFRVAILGSRGIPGNYGGFETFAEELGARLVARGFDVTVYGRTHHVPERLDAYRGCRLVRVPTVRTRSLDTLVATALQVGHALFMDHDAILAVNAANAPLLLPLRLARCHLVLNVDGIERLRAKWGLAGRLWYRLGELFAVHVPDVVVADAGVIADYYRERWGIDAAVVPYGSELPQPGGRDVLDRLGIVSDGYLLYVSRFEPENNPHRVVEEYGHYRMECARSNRSPLPLVMLGDAPYQQDWIAGWKSSAPEGVLFPGAIYGDGYRQLLAGCRLYLQATEIGGTHPALVEAMGFGCRILFNQTPENREVAEGCGLPFRIRRPGDLAAVLLEAVDDSGQWSVFREKALERSRNRYGWERVTDAYAALLRGDPLPPG